MATVAHQERLVLSEDQRNELVPELQSCLCTLIDLSLQLKQAHWNLLGDRFLSFHEQLDTIIETTRKASDDVAERIATLNIAADGRAATVSAHSSLSDFPEGRHHVDRAVTIVADRLANGIQRLRQSIKVAGETDPITEDLLIGISRAIEKHLWMVQSQEQ